MKFVGVDCATEDARVGVALGTLVGDRLEIQDASLCSRERSATETIADWLRADDKGGVIAIDAPLGWPKPLATTLIDHTAGSAIKTEAHAMFRRATDVFIQRELKKTPLDVGADRIARTAYAALQLLASLRERLGVAIPLAWHASDVVTLVAIEVYPAATLVAHRIRSSGYKKPQQVNERSEILEALRRKMVIRESVRDLTLSADLVDAVVCVLAGADFVAGRAMPPHDLAIARHEGWIWASRREA
jgi:predicted RNase H-like nuclease